MADGETHFLANVVGGAVMTLLAYAYLPEGSALPVLIGSTIGAFVTPDLDLEGRTHSEALLRRIPGIGLAFQWAWYPYATLHRHRGVSHIPVAGTLGRLAYSLAVLAIIYLIFGSMEGLLALVGSAWDWRERNGLILAAWIAQDINHWVFDGIFKG